MFLIIALFGLLALGLAFVTYLQSDLNQSTPPKPAPPAMAAPAVPAAGNATTEAVQPPAASTGAAFTAASNAVATPNPAESSDELRAALKEAAAALAAATAENKEAGPSTPP